MDLQFINKEKIASLLPMHACIDVMEKMFLSMSRGECIQPLRSFLMLPDKTGLLGMMPGYASSLGLLGIKVISVFHANRDRDLPSHQGVVMLFDAKTGTPLMIFDALEITAIRTAAVSALATKLLSGENSETLAIIGSGEQAQRHLKSITLVRKIKQINVWSRTRKNAEVFVKKNSDRYPNISLKESVKDAVNEADIVCTVTSSSQPIVLGEWISDGTHINAVGSSMATKRELDSGLVVKAKLFADYNESIFNEGGDFLIPKNEGLINDKHVRADLSELVAGKKPGRENEDEITVFKSLGFAAEDIFSAWYVYEKVKSESGFNKATEARKSRKNL